MKKKTKDYFVKEKETKEDFVKAVDIKQDEIQKFRISSNYINALWSMIDHIVVQCPKCGSKQSVRSVLNVKCRRCHRTYAVTPRNKRSNIVWCNPNRLNHLHQVIMLETEGRFENIL